MLGKQHGSLFLEIGKVVLGEDVHRQVPRGQERAGPSWRGRENRGQARAEERRGGRRRN